MVEKGTARLHRDGHDRQDGAAGGLAGRDHPGATSGCRRRTSWPNCQSFKDVVRGARPHPVHRRVAGSGRRAGGLRAGAGAHPAARAVRPADRRLPAGAGEAGPDAGRDHHDAADVLAAVDAGRPGPDDRGDGLAGQDELREKARTIIADARDLFGGDGILLEHDIARHHADIEAIYTFEGTDHVQALIVGREITGLSAITGRRPRRE